MSDDDAGTQRRNVTLAELGCHDCHMHLVAHRSVPRTEGATPKFMLICPGCGKGALIKAIGGELAFDPIEWTKKE